LVLPIIAYTLSSTKLEIRAKQFLPGIGGRGDKGGSWGSGEEMTQTSYTHKNKNKNKCYNKILGLEYSNHKAQS
jgi:hypothetical protein